MLLQCIGYFCRCEFIRMQPVVHANKFAPTSPPTAFSMLKTCSDCAKSKPCFFRLVLRLDSCHVAFEKSGESKVQTEGLRAFVQSRSNSLGKVTRHLTTTTILKNNFLNKINILRKFGYCAK